MKIADILIANDDDDDDDYYNLNISSSRSILPCWFFPFKRSREQHTNSSTSKRKISPSQTESQSRRKTTTEQHLLDQSLSLELEQEEDEERLKNKSAALPSSESAPMVDSSFSGGHIKDASFSLGLGIGLVFLTALSKKEINKMVELKMQMEALIKEVKDEMQKKDVLSMASKSNDIFISPNTNSSGVGNTINHPTNHDLEATSSTMDSNSNCNTTIRQDSKLGINQLEAELEAELEYMQFNLDIENLLEHQDQHWKEGTGSDESFNSSFGDVEHPQEPYETEQENGVSPIELERRLHELLEARQQERIKELESALAFAMDDLHQKKMEVSWWKDIAQNSLEHVQDATQSSR